MTTLPFVNSLPASYPRDSGYTYLDGLVTVTVRKRDTRYTVVPIAGGWRVEKSAETPGTDPTERHYNVSESFECDCRGYTAHATCRHAIILRDLVEAGLVEIDGERPESSPITESEIDRACREWEARLDAEHAIIEAYYADVTRPLEPCPF